MCVSISLSIYLSIYLSVCLSVCLAGVHCASHVDHRLPSLRCIKGLKNIVDDHGIRTYRQSLSNALYHVHRQRSSFAEGKEDKASSSSRFASLAEEKSSSGVRRNSFADVRAPPEWEVSGETRRVYVYIYIDIYIYL